MRKHPIRKFQSIGMQFLEPLICLARFGEGFAPKGMVNSIKALAGLYVPLDGINEVVLLPEYQKNSFFDNISSCLK